MRALETAPLILGGVSLFLLLAAVALALIASTRDYKSTDVASRAEFFSKAKDLRGRVRRLTTYSVTSVVAALASLGIMTFVNLRDQASPLNAQLLLTGDQRKKLDLSCERAEGFVAVRMSTVDWRSTDPIIPVLVVDERCDRDDIRLFVPREGSVWFAVVDG